MELLTHTGVRPRHILKTQICNSFLGAKHKPATWHRGSERGAGLAVALSAWRTHSSLAWERSAVTTHTTAGPPLGRRRQVERASRGKSGAHFLNSTSMRASRASHGGDFRVRRCPLPAASAAAVTAASAASVTAASATAATAAAPTTPRHLLQGAAVTLSFHSS
jgi:hypothetical protein